MGNIAISSLPQQVTMTDSTIVPTVSGGQNYQITGQTLKSYFVAGLGNNVSQIIAGNNITISPAGGTGNVTINAVTASGNGVPAGANGYIQYFSGGNFGATSDFTWNPSAGANYININSGATAYKGMRLTTANTETWFIGSDNTTGGGNFTINSNGTQVITATAISGGNTVLTVTGNVNSNNVNSTNVVASKVVANNIGATGVFTNTLATVPAGPGANSTLTFGSAGTGSYNAAGLELSYSAGTFTYTGSGTAVYSIGYDLAATTSGGTGDTACYVRVSTGQSTIASNSVKSNSTGVIFLGTGGTIALASGQSFVVIILNGAGALSFAASFNSMTITRIA